MSWNGVRVLVTGAGGFIGSHLSERLVREGARVRAFVRYTSSGSAGWLDLSPLRDELEVFRGDVTDADSVRSAVSDCEVVLHLAALVGIPYSYLAPARYVAVNITGSLNVLQAARSAGVRRLVFTSTSEVYGTAQRVPIDEGHPLVGQSPYSATKIAAEKLVESFHRSFGLPAAIVRPFNTFGPRQSTRAVIPTIIAQALEGGPIRLGSVEPTRDMNYVANTVDAFLAAASSAEVVGRAVNAGSGRGVSIGYLVDLVCRRLGIEPRIEVEPQRIRPKNSEVQRLVAANDLARELMGWTSRIGLEDGLDETIEWMRTHPREPEGHRYAV